METMTVDEVELVAPKTLKLIRSAQAGDPDALTQAVAENMGIVYEALKETNATGNDDLRQEAVIGLMDAIAGYDLESHWFAYSMTHVKRKIGRARQRNRLIPLPVGGTGEIPGIAKALRRAREELSVNGYTPSTTEVAASVGVDVELALRIEGADTPHVVFDDLRIAEADPGFEQVEVSAECAFYLDGLDDLEREIVARFYGVEGYAGESMPSIASSLGIRSRQASHIKDRAMKRMAEMREVAA